MYLDWQSMLIFQFFTGFINKGRFFFYCTMDYSLFLDEYICLIGNCLMFIFAVNIKIKSFFLETLCLFMVTYDIIW